MGSAVDRIDALNRVASEELREQLRWMRSQSGMVVESDRLRSLLMGFGSRKGIYKPRGAAHALWVRETLRGVYPDADPEVFPDGSWLYRYTPEGVRGETDMELPTNQALLRSMKDRVPVGVLRQRSRKTGEGAYEVLGLAYVTDFDGTHFVLRGEPIAWEELSATPAAVPKFRAFETVMPRTEVLQQQRDYRFGLAVRRAYNDRCSLCEIGFRIRGRPVGVEAAHIIPLEKHGTSRDVRNGILLCRNHHVLFDEFAWVPDEDLRVLVTVDAEFRRSAVANHVLQWEGKRLPNLPGKPELLPAAEAIRFRLDGFR
jgi:hypothetical protein